MRERDDKLQSCGSQQILSDAARTGAEIGVAWARSQGTQTARVTYPKPLVDDLHLDDDGSEHVVSESQAASLFSRE